ncbi:MAG: methylmalonyl-CoA epimerase [Sporocytophaga sp.]|uniref:methylmalonyl-CoA epimerase n=1 Tax=Sporocytophaga sp. TaxID=2231183 RepID=UPI001B13BAFB|nr:methylmalonyl-CoA epimerase [Sporocytophaga sp.]MBO9699144.1 methylmalonyl-CoA epimerase [Sporocytophaga sp.]
MKNLEHIGIAVKSIEAAIPLFSKLLNREPYKEEFVEGEKVRTLFFKCGNVKIELLESTTEDGAIAKFIEKRGEGIHHLAFEVEDINQEMLRMKDEGFALLNDQPKTGADNKMICFLHPKTTGGTLIELCQENKKGS